MASFISSFVALGVDDAVNLCDCCGKKNLKCTVGLENIETGDVLHYGRDCAGAALYGRKDRKNGERAEFAARRTAGAAPIVAYIKAGFDAGRRDADLVTEAVKMARKSGADRYTTVARCRLGIGADTNTPTAYEVDWTVGRIRFPFEGSAELIERYRAK